MRSADTVRTRKKKEKSSAEVIASNEDLLTEFLLRLPVKSLMNFKCLSKLWLSVISDPHFADRKYLKSNAISALFLKCDPYYELVPLDPSHKRAAFEHLRFSDYPHDTDILQSCKGLLCCRSFKEKKYFVYNPTTKQFRTLPPIPPVPGGSVANILGVNLAFDPSESHSYKVVGIRGNRKSPLDARQILIYSSETGHWRVSGAPFTALLFVDFGYAVYWNAAVQWYSWCNASQYFDLNEEVVREMPMPPYFSGSCYADRYFGESGGHFNIVDFLTDDLTEHFHVYEMERDRSSWILKFRVDPYGMAPFGTPCYPICPLSVVCVVREVKGDDSFLVVLTNNGKVIEYNFTRQTYHEICDIDSIELCGRPAAYQYIECLFKV